MLSDYFIAAFHFHYFFLLFFRLFRISEGQLGHSRFASACRFGLIASWYFLAIFLSFSLLLRLFISSFRFIHFFFDYFIHSFSLHCRRHFFTIFFAFADFRLRWADAIVFNALQIALPRRHRAAACCRFRLLPACCFRAMFSFRHLPAQISLCPLFWFGYIFCRRFRFCLPGCLVTPSSIFFIISPFHYYAFTDYFSSFRLSPCLHAPPLIDYRRPRFIIDFHADYFFFIVYYRLRCFTFIFISLAAAAIALFAMLRYAACCASFLRCFLRCRRWPAYSCAFASSHILRCWCFRCRHAFQLLFIFLSYVIGFFASSSLVTAFLFCFLRRFAAIFFAITSPLSFRLSSFSDCSLSTDKAFHTIASDSFVHSPPFRSSFLHHFH